MMVVEKGELLVDVLEGVLVVDLVAKSVEWMVVDLVESMAAEKVVQTVVEWVE